MGLFSGIAQASSRFEANYMKQGHYLVRIDKVKAAKNRSKQDYVAIEGTVLYAYPDGQGDLTMWHKVGEQASDVISSKHFDMFLSKFKTFAERATNQDFKGMDDSKVEQICEALTGEHQPVAGLVMEVNARKVITKGNNVEIVSPSWRGQVPVSEIAQILDAETIERFLGGEAGLQALAARQADFNVS